MGIPDEDKLGYLCQQDMNSVETSAHNIRAAIQAVNALMGKDTWVGAAADKWGGDFSGRMSTLGRLFDSYPAEEQRLIAKAQKDQADMDRKRTGAGQ
ncbi:hypothetical protein AB0M29_26575 [Streptomyces sp. NPDC051976]|uniref:hypothetical protein n=1 Tax=Streptomyces sp. NPDC051976 TaxID=3154947 RepID=UPI003435A57F